MPQLITRRLHRRARLAVFAVCLALLAAGSLVAQLRAQGGRPAAIARVAGDLYNISGEGGNVAVYVTGEGVVLVDDMYERNYAAVVAQVRSVTSQPIRYVLNTHQHDDHAGGNVGALADGIEVIAHRNVRANMVRLKQPGMPGVTFSDEASVTLGGKEVRAQYFGRGHTDGDAVIYFPAEKVIHTGDLFLARQPGARGLSLFVDAMNGGSLVEWVPVMDKILALDFTAVIPGHGAIADRAGVEAWRTDLIGMRDRLRTMLRDGRSTDDVAKVLVEEYRWPAGGLAIQQLDAIVAELRR